MDPKQNVTVCRLAVIRRTWVAFAATIALFALLPVTATAQCLEFNAHMFTPAWESPGAFRTTSASSDLSSVNGANFSVNGAPEMFDGLFDVKYTGQAFRQVAMIYTEYLQIDGQIVFSNETGYLVLEFNTDAYTWYENFGRFRIVDGGGIYAGASGTGTISIYQWDPSDNVAWHFIGDPCF